MPREHVEALRAASWARRARRALEDIHAKYAEIARLRKDVPWSLELLVLADEILSFSLAPPPLRT